jgi:hypothetical protein
MKKIIKGKRKIEKREKRQKKRSKKHWRKIGEPE